MPDPVSSKLIRAAADDELDAAGAAALDRQSGETSSTDVEARIRFERQLRRRVGVAMEGVNAPPTLTERLRTALAAAEDLELDDARPETAPEPVVARIGTETRTPRLAWLAGPPRANAFAVAASIVLIAGAVLVGIFGPRIDEMPVSTSRLAEAANYASDEHMKCAQRAGRFDRKTQWNDLASASEGLAHHLGATVFAPDLSAEGFTFIGAGPCHVPGAERSAHILYRNAEGMRLSIFVVPMTPPFDVELPEDFPSWEWRPAGDPARCERRVLASTDHGAVYWIACCHDGEVNAVAERITMKALGGSR